MATTDRARAAMGMDARQQQGGGSNVPATIEKRIAEVRTMEQAFADAVASGLEPRTLIRDAITAVRTTPKLAECTKESFFGALMTAAQLGLRPNVATLGHGWVLPRWNGRKQVNEAGWQLGYQGMVELGYRSGLVAKITAHTIYEGEQHRVAWGTEDVLLHEPLQDESLRGGMLWHYAVVWLKTGGVIWNAITDEEAQGIMRAYAGKDRQGNVTGPWVQNYLPMARKTALRGLWRYMPKTPALSLALATDEVVREGMSKDAAVVSDEPGQESVTLTVDQQPEPEPEPEPQGEPPVDAEVVPDEPQPADDAAAAQAEAAGLPDEWPTAQGPRKRFDDNSARKAYIGRLKTKLGSAEAVGALIAEVHGEIIPLAYLSTAELRTLADHEPAAPSE